MKQSEVAEATRVGNSMVSQVEKGRSENPSSRTLEEIASALGYRLSYTLVSQDLGEHQERLLSALLGQLMDLDPIQCRLMHAQLDVFREG